jgi:small subunit ribosomal protein S18
MAKKNIKLHEVHYRNPRILGQFLTPAGSLVPRTKTGVSAKLQRKLTQQIKRARFLALLPFVSLKK